MRDTVVHDLRKYPDLPLRRTKVLRLGTNDHGTWMAVPAGHHIATTMGVVTAGYPVLFLVPHEGWWTARHFPDGGWKVDIATPPVWDGDSVRMADLALDVRRLHGRVWVEDEDEFADRIEQGAYSPDVVTAARGATDEIAWMLSERVEPFGTQGDEWFASLAERDPRPRHSSGFAAVLFDMGGVLLHPATGTGRARWCARLGIDGDGLRGMMAAAIGPGWEGGRKEDEILRLLAEQAGITVDDADELVRDLHTDEALDPILMDFVDSLPDTVAVAVLANNGAGVRRHWRAVHGIEERFSLVVISGEERIAKPDARIYRAAAARLGVPPDACVFVDDQPSNVEGAERAGMRGVLHTSAVETVAILSGLLGW